MLKTLLALALVAGAPSAARAKTFMLGTDPAAASVSLPDAWDVETADGGIEALSPDKGVYLSAEIVASEDLKAAGREVSQTLAEQKITLKQDSRKVAPLTIAGMSGASITWDGTDENGPTQVHMIVLKARSDQEVVLLRWGDATAEAAHAGEIGAIVRSLAPVR